MSRVRTKTDNSYFEAKVKLRLDNLPDRKKIRVLDCFAGDGRIWSKVRSLAPGKTIAVLSIDEKRATKRLHLVGDNMKFLASMDLGVFDVIDLDAYGSPVKQLRLILGRPLKAGVILHVTFIQRVYGALPRRFLAELGYSRQMVRKIPALFHHNGQEKLFQWLSLHGVTILKMLQTADRRKTYFCTKIGYSTRKGNKRCTKSRQHSQV